MIDLQPNSYFQRSLNAFAAQPWSLRKQVRAALQEELRNGSISSQCLLQLSDVENHLPMKTGGFSDFYTSLEHCQNVRLEHKDTHPFRFGD